MQKFKSKHFNLLSVKRMFYIYIYSFLTLAEYEIHFIYDTFVLFNTTLYWPTLVVCFQILFFDNRGPSFFLAPWAGPQL